MDFFGLRCFVSVIGGAGVIGSNLVLERFAESNEQVVGLGKFTYVESQRRLNDDRYYVFVQGDIPKKLIPLMRVNMLPAKLLAMYCNGQQIRSRFYVKDHCSSTRRVLETGSADQAHDVDGGNDRLNLGIAHRFFAPYSSDRDCRHTADAANIECDLG